MSDKDFEAFFWPLARGETLSNHDWFPFFGNKFLNSRFMRLALAEGRREDIATGMILWAEAVRQDPAGTLPDDDLELMQIARFGYDLEAWKAARAGVLAGWQSVHVDDSAGGHEIRLGHPVLAEICEGMHKRKLGRDAARAAGVSAQRKSRIIKKMREMGTRQSILESEQVIGLLCGYFEQNELFVTTENVKAGLAAVVGADVVSLRPGASRG